MTGRPLLQLPGPTNIPDPVLEAFRRPAMDFADPVFAELVDGVFADLAAFAGADHTLAWPSVGHGMWEAAMLNCVPVGARVLHVATGLFSGLWADVCRRLGYDVVETEATHRRAPDPAMVGEVLAADRDHTIRAVCLTHTETSTGVRTDLDAMRRAVDEADHPALLIVDAVASLGTERFDLRAQRLDVALAASQKGLMLPPGLGLVFVSREAAALRDTTEPPPYWDWRHRVEPEFTYQRFGGTPLMQHVYALRVALDLLAAEGGREAVVARHARLAGAVHAAVEGWAEGGKWEILAVDPAERAYGVTAVQGTDLDAATLKDTLRSDLAVGIGSGMVGRPAEGFRIGHLGHLNETMVLGALAGLELAFRRLGVPHGSGLGRALDALAPMADS